MKKPAIIAASVAALVIVVIVAVLANRTESDPTAVVEETRAADAHPNHFSTGPQPWSVKASRWANVELRESGPFLQLTVDTWLALSPTSRELSLEWTKETEDAITRLKGTGSWRGHPTTVRWTFARGNPQAAFELEVSGVTGSDLTEAFDVQWLLPAGDVRFVNHELRVVPWVEEPVSLNAWTPTWLEWTGSQQVLSLNQGIYDQLHIEPSDAGGVNVRVSLASSETRPRLVECAPEQPVEVVGRFALTLGTGTPVLQSRWSNGAEAVIAAVFENPANHPDPLAAAGIPMDSTDAARRVRTLALGHSDVGDPRHGNGGVLGVGLSATIEAPPELSDADSEQLQNSFKSTRLELATANGPVRLTGGDCAAIRSALEAKVPTIVAGYSTYEGAYQNTLNSPNLSVGATSPLVTLAQLDGRRASVTDQALGKLYIDRLLRERGGLFLAAPLVASRNPLVPAGKDGLLTPERDGHWTITEDLVYTFADLELRTETESFLMAGVGETVDHWRNMRRAEVWWGPDSVVLSHIGASPLEGASFFAAGTHDPTGSFLDGRDIRDVRAAPQTWFWGTLPADEPISVGLGDGYRAPEALEWTFSVPAD